MSRHEWKENIASQSSRKMLHNKTFLGRSRDKRIEVRHVKNEMKNVTWQNLFFKCNKTVETVAWQRTKKIKWQGTNNIAW